MPSASMTPLKPTRSLIVRWGVSWSMIATSPLLTSRSTRHVERPLLDSATPRLVATRLLPTPPLVEKTVMTLPRGASASAWATAAAWATSAATSARAVLRGGLGLVHQGLPDGVGHAARSLHRRGDAGQVAGGDDLAHAAAQRQRERVAVDVVAEQDHAEVGAVHPRPLGQLGRRVARHGGPDHDGELVGGGADVLVETLEVGEGHRPVQHRLEDRPLGAVGLEDGGHGCTTPEELGEDRRPGWPRGRSPTFESSVRSAKLSSALRSAWIRRSASSWVTAMVRIVRATSSVRRPVLVLDRCAR